MRKLSGLVLFFVIAPALRSQLLTSPSILNLSFLAGNVNGLASIQVTSNEATDYVVYATSEGGWLTVVGQNVVLFSSGLPLGTWESSTPSSIGVFVNGATLGVGAYTGTVTLVACTVDSSGVIETYGNPINIPVNVTVGAPTLSVSPTSLSFQFSPAASGPQTQALAVKLTQAGIDPSLSFSSSVTGGSWLSSSSIAQLLPGTVSVSVSPVGLSAGIYNGSVLITLLSSSVSQCPAGAFAPCSINSVAVPVRVTIEQPTLSVSPTSLSFSCIKGAACNPNAQMITLSSDGPVNYSVVSSATWLLANPTSGLTSSNTSISVNVNVAGLNVGTYQGSLTINTSGSPETVNVTLVISAPTATIDSVVNAASYGIAAAGGAASIFGAFPGTLTTSTPVTPLSTMMDSVSVFVDGIAAPLYYVSTTQINIQIPWAVSSDQKATINITDGSWSATTTADVQAAAPGIFEVDSKHDGAILHSDFRLVSATNPAAPGEIVLIYATGLGSVTPPQVDGHEASDTQVATATNPQVQIGNQPATVEWTGLAPGFVGLYQINAMVPLSSPSGNDVITLVTSNRMASNSAVIAVK